jgi:hypothetical protein
VEETSTGYRLGESDIGLAWVPALPHWVGDEALAQNPLRCETVEGFFILRDPVRRGETLLLTDQATAEDYLQELARRTGARLGLPTSLQWEIAARGSDGRRFPWGNGHEASWSWRASPWGLLNLYGEAPCWCDSGLLAGGEKVVSVAEAVRQAEAGDRGSLRPVVMSQ